MVKKLIFVLLFSFSLAFVAFRFGIFSQNNKAIDKLNQSAGEISIIPTVLPPLSITPIQNSATVNAIIKILDAPKEASASQAIIISWLVETTKVATISHTAVHFGKISRPDAKLPSDYPEKSAIFKGTTAASFSATLRFPSLGTYYWRAHAIIDEANIWSKEQTIQINQQATPSATPASNF